MVKEFPAQTEPLLTVIVGVGLTLIDTAVLEELQPVVEVTITE